ncbi:MAG: citrate lyase holo-[acyl-carrier protein] synthase [Maledivibacter sp.]|nr:citrate lyase holo-[acyl-carrier protein] synthase [Maledivibacter sp.]
MTTNENIESILLERENRVIYQNMLIKSYKNTLIAFKLNIPGPKKDGQLYRKIFSNGLKLLKASLKQHNINPIFEKVFFKATGPMAFLVVDKKAEEIKILCTEIEEEDNLGRIYDFDVIDSSGNSIGRGTIGKAQRKCFLCDKYVWVCSRSRAHSVEEMLLYIHDTAETYFKNKEN